MAEAIPPPMPPADIVTISIQAGKTRATPAIASGPSRATKKVSTVLEAAWTRTTTILGAASRRRVGRTGRSSRRWVAAATAIGAGEGAAAVMEGVTWPVVTFISQVTAVSYAR